jgi:hypothetical protein
VREEKGKEEKSPFALLYCVRCCVCFASFAFCLFVLEVSVINKVLCLADLEFRFDSVYISRR